MAQATSTGTPVASQQSQQAQAQQGQQQIHLQQSTTTTAIHAGNQQQVQAAAQQQHHHAATPTNPMQQLQVIQQPLQNQYLQQLYSTQQGQILMNGNLLHHPGINPQIQVCQICPSSLVPSTHSYHWNNGQCEWNDYDFDIACAPFLFSLMSK